MSRICGVLHDSGVACRLAGRHKLHEGGEGVHAVAWINTAWRERKRPERKPTEHQLMVARMRALAERVREAQRKEREAP